MNSPAKAVRLAPSFQCRLCGLIVSTPALSLGRLPVSNQFTRTGKVGTLVDLDIVECETCQLIQLRETPPIDALVPELPWIRYREPEGHLDALVEALLAFRPKARTALGTGPFEQPLLSRLAARGLATTAVELEAAAGAGRHPYLESWQASLNGTRLNEVAGRMGTFDIVSCRYIVEHSPDPVASIRALRAVLGPDGLLLIEVPDSSKFLASRDYCFLWEEHSCYFVEQTLRRLAETGGYRVLSMLRYPGALEDTLVAVLEAAQSPSSPLPAHGASSPLFQAYRDRFAATREDLRARLDRAAGPAKERVALFGIGHQAIMFVNAFGLAADIALAVDDDPDKAGFFPPGFQVPVVSSQVLLQDERIHDLSFCGSAPHPGEGTGQARAAHRARGRISFDFCGARQFDREGSCLMALVQKSPEVFLAEGPISAIGEAELNALRAAVKASAKRRARINAHPDGEDALHEMIIAIDPSSYIRPHKHPGKSEAFHIIEGEVDIVVFTDDGEIDRIVPLGPAGSRRSFYYRMSTAFFHTLIIRSDILVVHEITNGPFRPSATVFADFAPDDRDAEQAAAYQAELLRRVTVLQGTAA